MGSNKAMSRSRWAAIGAAIAVAVGAGGVAVTQAAVSSGEKLVFVAISPCRLFDLRSSSQVGPRGTPLGAGETYTQTVRGANGNCNISTDASAVAMNVTVVDGTASSYLTIWPSDVARPLASNLNWVAGAPPTPNKVDVKLAADGSIDLFNNLGTVSVLADVVGYYADHNHDDRYYTKAQIGSLPSSSVVAGGVVNANGTISSTYPRFGTSWTVNHAGTGVYSVTIPGLNPGCQNPLLPLVIVSGLEFSTGWQSFINFGSVSCGNGDTNVQINSWNGAGTATDRGFQFIAYRPGPNQILPASAGARPTMCTVSGGTATCV